VVKGLFQDRLSRVASSLHGHVSSCLATSASWAVGTGDWDLGYDYIHPDDKLRLTVLCRSGWLYEARLLGITLIMLMMSAGTGSPVTQTCPLEQGGQKASERLHIAGRTCEYCQGQNTWTWARDSRLRREKKIPFTPERELRHQEIMQSADDENPTLSETNAVTRNTIGESANPTYEGWNITSGRVKFT
jgi:hypothetical protein